MTTQGGYEYALEFLERTDAGCIALFGASPCTWSTPWQYMQERLRGSGPKYRQHMNELRKQFSKLIHYFLQLAREVTARGGYIVFERLAHNRLW